MPRQIEPSRAALADFDALYDSIARDNPRAAAQLLRTLDRPIQLLAARKDALSSKTPTRNDAPEGIQNPTLRSEVSTQRARIVRRDARTSAARAFHTIVDQVQKIDVASASAESPLRATSS